MKQLDYILANNRELVLHGYKNNGSQFALSGTAEDFYILAKEFNGIKYNLPKWRWKLAKRLLGLKP